jgi:hypothetical protein
MAAFIVFLHYPENAGENHEYGCCSGIHADDAAGAAASYMAGHPYARIVFTMEQEAVVRQCPNYGTYDTFGPWFSRQMVDRGLPLSDFYRATHLGDYQAKAVAKVQSIGLRKPPAELEPFWWEQFNGRAGRPINAAAAMDITRVMCGGRRSEES